MLSGKLCEFFRAYCVEDEKTARLYDALKNCKEKKDLEAVIRERREDYLAKKRADLLSGEAEKLERAVLEELESYSRQWQLRTEKAGDSGWEAEFAFIKERFSLQTKQRENVIDKTMDALEHTFCFLEEAFGESQEMAAFLAELHTNGDSIRFLRENDCPYYYKYNKGLLFDERQKEILTEMENLEKSIDRSLN